jgi:hypothetical protein
VSLRKTVPLREEGRSPRCFIDYSIVLQLLILVPVKEEGPSSGDFIVTCGFDVIIDHGAYIQ